LNVKHFEDSLKPSGRGESLTT